jgi:hypothetical protein
MNSYVTYNNVNDHYLPLKWLFSIEMWTYQKLFWNWISYFVILHYKWSALYTEHALLRVKPGRLIADLEEAHSDYIIYT